MYQEPRTKPLMLFPGIPLVLYSHLRCNCQMTFSTFLIITLLPDLNISLQFIAGTHLEDQRSCDDMEDGLMHSVAAQLQDIKTVDWNQVRTATNSDSDMLSLLSIIEEGMPDHRSQLSPPSETIINFVNIYIALMVWSFTKIKLLFHHP